MSHILAFLLLVAPIALLIAIIFRAWIKWLLISLAALWIARTIVAELRRRKSAASAEDIGRQIIDVIAKARKV